MDVDGEESLPIVGQQRDSFLKKKRLSTSLFLSKHPSTFQSRRGLSPHRCRNHAINLQLNRNSTSVGPYRYAYHHKDEIEKQAERLLAEGKLR
jgi:hypothetical protein